MTLFAFALLATSAQVVPFFPATVSEIVSGSCTNFRVRVRGTVVDAFPDETDKNYCHVFLYDKGDILDAAILQHSDSWTNLCEFIDSPVSMRGRIQKKSIGLRKYTNPFLLVPSRRGLPIYRLGPRTDAPPLGIVTNLGPNAIRNLGRRRTTGLVRAVWQDAWMLIETNDRFPVKVRLAYGLHPPAIGTSIAVTGIVDTDTVNILLTHAVWKPAPMLLASEPESPVRLSDLSPFADSGTTVSASGIVRYRHRNDSSAAESLLLDCQGKTVEIDPGPCAGLFGSVPLGSEIEVTGCLNLTVLPGTLNQPFVNLRGHVLVLRSPSDLRILSRPSWWTPLKLVVVIALLLVVIVAAVVWNRILRGIVAQRSQELAAEQLANSESDLRFCERNTLAIELHDALSQTLTGAAMEIQAAVLNGEALSPDLRTHLQTAGQALQSCRNELRNCLWDLRSETLDYADMTEAILKTLEPHINDSRLTVRFNVPRRDLTDSAAHAILCVVRELVLNALRHGQAKAIRVAGCLDGRTVSFSVTDDGSGFQEKTAQGVCQGHFGLQGIRERLRRFDGQLDLVSEPGQGTKATATLMLPSESE